jgi:hypothetical protein
VLWSPHLPLHSWLLVLPSTSCHQHWRTASSCPTGKQPEWFLEIDAGDIDTRADPGLNYVADPGQRRLTFAAAGGLWSLRFPNPETYRAFMTELEVSLRLGGRTGEGSLLFVWARGSSLSYQPAQHSSQTPIPSTSQSTSDAYRLSTHMSPPTPMRGMCVLPRRMMCSRTPLAMGVTAQRHIRSWVTLVTPCSTLTQQRQQSPWRCVGGFVVWGLGISCRGLQWRHVRISLSAMF